MPHRVTLCSITAPLPGWRRLRNVRTGKTMDFNEANSDHMALMAYFVGNPAWEDITETYKDQYIDEEPKNDQQS